MDKNQKVRIRKPLENGKHLKRGVITVETEQGYYYRIACEGCGLALKLRRHPLEGKPVYCRECQNIADVGKPETRLVRHYGKYDYETPCDECGTVEQTSFLPKRSRPFLCNTCLKASRSERDTKGTPLRIEENNVHPVKESDKPTEVETTHREKPVETHDIACSKCRKTVTLKFKPSSKRPFLCSDCHSELQEIRRGEKPDTKVFFNLECSDCGKKETLDFIPTFPDRALCSDCFEKMKRRKK
jgi:CxxC-x17-CxxC domain-containing protein